VPEIRAFLLNIGWDEFGKAILNEMPFSTSQTVSVCQQHA